MSTATRTSALLLLVAAAFAGAVILAPPTAAATGCGGKKPPKRGGGHWRCTFSDEFNGTRLDPARWLPQRTDTSGYTNGKTACFVNRPHNIWVSKGTLKLRTRREAAPFTCRDPAGDFATPYTSGMVSTWGRFSQAYGRFEIRARVWSARLRGLQTSLWLWPAGPRRHGPWPTGGEIDIAEMFSAYPDRAIPYIHYTPATFDPNVTRHSCRIKNLAAFHTYGVVWTKRAIKVIYDRKTCLVNRWRPASPLRSPQPFNRPFIVALTQALGLGDNAFDPASTPLPAITKVDYVRVWR